MYSHDSQLRQLLTTNTHLELERAVSRIAQAHGIDYWCYALDLPLVERRRPQFLLGTFPQTWIDHYFTQDFLRVDPVAAHCHAHATPMLWPGRQNWRGPGGGLSLAAKRLFREAAEHGLKSGISIPIHGLGCAWGMVSFASGDPLHGETLGAQAAALHILAHYIHEAGHRYAHQTTLPPPPHLTTRELECLHWAAEGKTSWEIGRVLGVSERTVVFHLQNAARKFGVNGRQSAVARAIASGLIEP